MNNGLRRSRKHVLEWIESATFRDTLNALLGSSGVSVEGRDIHRPAGQGDGLEFELPDFCGCFRPRWNVHEGLRSWWLPASPLNQNARTPLWDLISTCTILGRKGLLLVEAKAHEGELDWKGKGREAKGSEQAGINHDHIHRALANISQTLTKASGTTVALGVESHYELAQRVAWAAFLAQQGIPVALLHLGFTGDSSVPRFLKDDAHWQRLMGAYMVGKLPLGLPEKWVRFPNGGAFAFLIRSRPVLKVTPSEELESSHEAGIDGEVRPREPQSKRSISASMLNLRGLRAVWDTARSRRFNPR